MELEYRYNPFKWSEEYVRTHTNECSDDLLMLLDVSIKLVHENNLADAETGFMHVIYGLDTVDIIAALETDENDKPKTTVTIESATFVQKKQ